MPLTQSTRLLFDAACVFTASDSPLGGSAYLLDICARGYLQAVVSYDILVEAERNIVAKLPVETHTRYRRLLASKPFEMVTTRASRTHSDQTAR
jgi:hypothetical protein